jgi:transcriptional regulator with XRE-family HTH domain
LHHRDEAYDFWRTRSSHYRKIEIDPSGVWVQYGFIERLREVVEHVGGQKELERLSGVDQTTISAWLNRIKNPKFQTVKKIADATGFDAEWLYLGRGPKRAEDTSLAAADRTTLDCELLARIIEQVESALTLRGDQHRLKSREKARVVAAAYEFYLRSGKGDVRRAKILDLLRRSTLNS